MNRAIGKLIMSDQTHMLPSQLQTGKDVGMQTMDQALLGAIQAREVDPEDAFTYAQEQARCSRATSRTAPPIRSADLTQGVS